MNDAADESNVESNDSEQPEPVNRGRMLLLAVVFEGGLLVLAVVLGYFLNIRFWESALGSVTDLIIGALLSIPLTAAVIAIVESRGQVFERVRSDLEKIVDLLGNCRPVDLLIIALLAGVCEEALFRGFLQTYITGIAGPVMAIGISSIIFGALHAVSFSYFVFATGISVGLGILFIVTDGLAAPVALHAAYDFAALLYGIHLRPLGERTDSES